MLDKAIDTNDENELEQYFGRLLNTHKLVAYIHELTLHIDEIDKKKIKWFLNSLVRTLEKIYRINNMEESKEASSSYRLMISLLKRGSREENTVLLHNLINESDISYLPIICELIIEIEKAYGRMGAYRNSGYQLIDESNLDEIEQILLKKINELIQTNGICDYVKPECVCGMWQYLDKEAFGIYINELVDNPKNILRCLHSSMQKEGTEGANGKLMGQKDNEDSDFLIEE